MNISIDASEVRTAAADLRRAPALAAHRFWPIVKRGAVNISKDMKQTARRSRSFRPIARAISFDILDGGYTAEIGPVKGSPGSLANIAYFGTSRGGGTVPDPQIALEAEIPGFAKSLGEAAEKMVFG